MLDAYESQLNPMNNYQELAQRTSAAPSPELIDRLFHPQTVNALIFLMQEAKSIGARLDMVKRHIFYGKPAGFFGGEDFHLTDDQKKLLVNENGRRIKVIHGIIGILTEAGELAETLYSLLFQGEDFDFINIKEEGGDTFWYLAELLTGANASFGETQRLNIAKLVARYGEKFSEFKALNRDLDKERGVLEGQDETKETTQA